MLRGLFWVTSGSLAFASEPAQELAYLEIRDQGTPLGLRLLPSGTVHLTEDDDVQCRILMRPEGVQVCDKNQSGLHSGIPTYVPLPVGKALRLGRTSFRHLQVQPPDWALKQAAELQP